VAAMIFVLLSLHCSDALAFGFCSQLERQARKLGKE